MSSLLHPRSTGILIGCWARNLLFSSGIGEGKSSNRSLTAHSATKRKPMQRGRGQLLAVR